MASIDNDLLPKNFIVILDILKNQKLISEFFLSPPFVDLSNGGDAGPAAI
jgi:hypothetical protein